MKFKEHREAWEPILNQFNQDTQKVADYMYMGSKDDINYYKHQDTRNYLKLTDEGEEI